MLNFYQKRTWRAFVYSPVMVVVLLVACLALARIVYERYTIEREMYQRQVDAEANIAELEARKKDLTEKVDYLSHERGIEAEMRRNFDVAQPGEKVVIILDKEEPKIEPLASTTPVTDNPPWYQFWR